MTIAETEKALIMTIEGRAAFLRHAQAMIAEAEDIAERMIAFIRSDGDALYVEILDENDQAIDALCDGPFSDWRMARKALDRHISRLDDKDPELLAQLLDHVAMHYSERNIEI